MNPLRILLGLGALLIALAGSFTFLQLRQRDRDLREQEAQVRSEFAANRRLAAALRTEPQPAAVAQPLGTPAAATRPATTEMPAAANNAIRGQQITIRLREMPEYAPHRRRELRRQTMGKYAELFAELRLSPERLESLKVILDDRSGTSADAYAAAIDHGYKAGSPEFAQLMTRYAEEAERRLREFLGPDDYARYRRFEQSVYWQATQLLEVEDYFGDRGVAPLTTGQKHALTDAYLKAKNWRPLEGNPPAGVLYRLRNEQLGALAAGALEPAQHEALVAYLQFLNSRSQVLAQLLRPEQPDSVVVIPGSSSTRR